MNLLSDFMRVLLMLVSLVIVSACSKTQAGRNATTHDPELKSFIGKTVTLHGQLELADKVGPDIQRAGEPVYLVPHGSFSWGSNYERMQGKAVSISGVLHFQHCERGKVPDSVQQPPDYFYFDAKTAEVRLE